MAVPKKKRRKIAVNNTESVLDSNEEPSLVEHIDYILGRSLLRLKSCQSDIEKTLG